MKKLAPCFGFALAALLMVFVATAPAHASPVANLDNGYANSTSIDISTATVLGDDAALTTAGINFAVTHACVGECSIKDGYFDKVFYVSGAARVPIAKDIGATIARHKGAKSGTFHHTAWKAAHDGVQA